MKTKHFSIALLAALCFFILSFKMIEKLQQFPYPAYLTEKVYLHLDKPHYALGTTIWFKAYMQTENPAHLDSMSKVLYVELIKPDNQVAKRLTLKINEGSTHGDFNLADTLLSGNYRIRAYTNYMRNFDNFFEKSITVINPKKGNGGENDSTKIAKIGDESLEKALSSVQTNANFDFQFFPEGGDLVENLQSIVAFKASSSTGKGMRSKGEVFDNEGIKVAIFQSNDMGTGKFKLSPLPNRIYTAKVIFENGMEKSYELPKAQKSGFVMTIDNLDKDKLKIRILKSAKANLTLVAQQYGKVYFMVQDSSDKNAVSTEIAKNIFPSGIVHFTLFDEKNIPHCERLVYVNHFKTLNLDLQTDKKEYKPREKVNLTLEIDEDKFMEGDFSLAVTDSSSVEAHKGNILTYHLLTSELKGYIENPAYYFEQTTESNKALDNLLLTQGWRRFTWKDLKNKQFSNFPYQMEHGISLSGTAKDEYGKMVKNKTISLLNLQTNFLVSNQIDEKGYFQITDLDIKDSIEVMLRVEKEKNVRIKFEEKIFPVIVPSNHFFEQSINTDFFDNSKKTIKAAQDFRAESDVKLLKAVTVKDKKIEQEYVPTTLKLHGAADAVIKGEVLKQNGTSYLHLLNGLTGRVPGVSVIPSKIDPTGPPTITIRGGGGSSAGGDGSWGGSSPLFLFDGIMVNIDFFGGINPNDIDYIEILKNGGASAYGSRAAGGVIAVYSKKGADKDYSNYVKKKVIYGFYTAKEFYSPNYESPTETEKLRPDYRTTIYWNSNMKTEEGEASLSFFCADVPTKYRIVVEGRAKNGMLGRKEIFVEVKK